MPAPKGNRYAAGNRGGGRPTTYHEKYAKDAYKLCLLGATNGALAEFFGVSVGCIEKWMRQQEEFRKAIGRARDEEDANVARSLYRRAKGYKHKAVKIFYNPKLDKVVKVPYIEKLPPETNACRLILMNKKGWKENKAEEWTGDITSANIKVDLSQIDTNQLGQETLDKIAELIQKDLAERKDRKLEKQTLDKKEKK